MNRVERIRAERHGRIIFVIFTGVLMIPAFFVAVWATQGTLIDFHGLHYPVWVWWVWLAAYVVFAGYQFLRVWKGRLMKQWAGSMKQWVRDYLVRVDEDDERELVYIKFQPRLVAGVLATLVALVIVIILSTGR